VAAVVLQGGFGVKLGVTRKVSMATSQDVEAWLKKLRRLLRNLVQVFYLLEKDLNINAIAMPESASHW
jgi:hypothetical protein